MTHLPSGGTIFTPKAEMLRDVLLDIHKHKTALPDFQRPWVWEPDMVRELILSVAYRYPAGSLLTMPILGNSFALRAFEGAGPLPPAPAKPAMMVLDGQQRLTSLYQALFRSQGVRVKDRTFHFYLDVKYLLSDPPPTDAILDTALFYVSEEKNSKRVRYESLKPLYEITTQAQEIAEGAMPLYLSMDKVPLGKWKRDYLRPLAHNDIEKLDALEVDWDRLVGPWLEAIHTYQFPVIELGASMPLDAICHIFEKVNSTGVALDVFDLCTAILWSEGFQLNKEWETTHGQLRPSFPMQDISGTYFLQGLSLLASLDRKQAKLNSTFAVTCRKADLMKMSKATVQKWWPVLVSGYQEAVKFMADQGILSKRVLPYSTLIIPLAAIFAHVIQVKGQANVGAVWPKVRQWYWCSVFSQRYSSKTETTSAQDFEQVLNWIDGGSTPDIIHAFNFRADALEEITSIRNAIYKGVLCLLSSEGAKDFGGGGKLSTHLAAVTKQDHHHIFPTKALATLGVTDSRGDAIINKTLINAAVNQSIGGNLPSLYIKNSRAKMGAALFDEILASHQIDAALLSSDQWPAFIQDRRERIRGFIHAACGGHVQPFTN